MTDLAALHAAAWDVLRQEWLLRWALILLAGSFFRTLEWVLHRAGQPRRLPAVLHRAGALCALCGCLYSGYLWLDTYRLEALDPSTFVTLTCQPRAPAVPANPKQLVCEGQRTFELVGIAGSADRAGKLYFLRASGTPVYFEPAPASGLSAPAATPR